jgi:hypothetical protein
MSGNFIIMGIMNSMLAHRILCMTPNFAYLSQGKLYLHHADHHQEVESDFGRSVQIRNLQAQRQKAWKNNSWNETTLPEGLRQKLDQAAESIVNIAITSICQVTGGQLLYALSAGDVSGLFAYNPESNREDRLFHNSEFQVQDLDFHPGHNLVVCTKTHRTGISNIATMPRNSIKLQEITEGDSLDLAPRWVPGKHPVIVYQSAGIGRTSDGLMGDRAPFTIEQLDFATEKMITLAEDPKSDLVAPQIGADGFLYYIRRPYKFQSQISWWQTIKSIVQIPVQLVYAIGQFVNFFTQMYTGKPLLRNNQNQQIEPKSIKAWGEYLNPDLMKGQAFSEPDAPSLVPTSWQLIRQSVQGGETDLLAQGVLSYDLSSDGSIVYTNGSGIYCLQPNGTCQRLLVSSQVESVRSL